MTPEELLAGTAALSPEQVELLDEVLAERGEEFGAFPLSAAQERLWFLDRLVPENPAYNIAAGIELRGPLDREALRASLGDLVERHEVLRTVFVAVRGRPLQVVREVGTPRMPVVCLTGPGEGRCDGELESLAAAEARRPFVLSRGPLLRTVLVEMAPRRHVLLLTVHHIVSDGWSSRILAVEIGRLYEARTQGRRAALPRLEIQYADYASWERERAASEGFAARLAAAAERLADLPVLDLPGDRPRPAVQSLRGGRVPVSLAPGVVGSVERLCREEGVTLFAALVASFAALLARLAGLEEVALGAPSANRERVELEPLVGCFVNTLVVRLDVSEAGTWRELLLRTKGAVLEAFGEADVPFERLVEAVMPNRALSHSPLVQVMVALQAEPLELRMANLELELLDVDTRTAKLDLTLALTRAGDGLLGWIEYSADLFDATTVDRLSRRWASWLEGAGLDPDRRPAELCVLLRGEAQQILREWAGTPVEGECLLLHELVALQAAATPEATAVARGAEALSYGELLAAAEELASRLRALGVGPGDLVGVFLDRSPVLVTAILAILGTGAAYVPLDPSYPRGRIAYTLDDARAVVVLTRRVLESRLPASGARILAVDGEDEARSPARCGVAPGLVDPRSLAYVIYTSGSTGRPKGVAITHGSAATLVRWASQAFRREEIRGVLAGTSVCFDLSVFELFVPLARGGCVILAGDVLELRTLPAADRVTLINTVPSAMAELAHGALPPSIAVVNLAGEPLHSELVETVHQAIPGCRVLNLYGPSEDTTYSTGVEIPAGSGSPTIGRPLEGTRVHVLDRALRPVPTGIPGELCLGGEGLARGYLRRPGPTAERFVPDPAAAERAPGVRLYRTGDLARWLPDGELSFLGRLDHQVKLRGFRIEPGEVEGTLRALPGVRDAVVVVHGNGAARRLTAYAATGDAVVEPAGLRAALRAHLPEFMVPATVVALASLPRTPNGKVDRGALPAPGSEVASEVEGAFRHPLEELLAGIWEEVLGVRAVGPGSHFFELGGHSLLAVRVLARAGEILGVEAPVRMIFEAPVLADLARAFEELRRAGGPGLHRSPGPAPRAPGAGGLPLAPGQERLWFLDRLEPGNPSYNVPVALRLSGPLVPRLLRRAFDRVVGRHEALRTRFVETDGGPVQVIDPPAASVVSLPLLDLRSLAPASRGREASRLLGRLARQPFDLERGPLVRVRLVRHAAADHVLLLVFHHAVIDAWSVALLFDELGTVYAGDASDLPAPALQFPDYALWHRELLKREENRLLRYWSGTLSPLPPSLELPTDRPRPAARGHRGARVRVRFGPSLPERLSELSRREGATLFMIAFAAFSAFLGRLAGRRELAVGAPAANRERPELEGVVGFLVNTLVLRADLRDDPTFRELIRRARSTVLDAFAHAELPFERLVDELEPRRDLARTPLFQAFLVLQDGPLPTPDLPDVAAELQPLAHGTAKFDLTLALAGGNAPRGAQELAGWLEYDADLFDATTAHRMADHLALLLEEAADDPIRPVAEARWLRAAQRHQISMEWAAGVPVRHRTLEAGTLDALFRAQVARAPEAEALVAGDERLSYAELGRRARELAGWLRRVGVGPEDRVAVFLDRGAHLVASLLGVLESGAAYVPLDPAYPTERVELMLRDSQARAVVTEHRLSDRLGAWSGLRLLVDREEGFGPGLSGPDEIPPDLPAGRLAYVVYTSGSTGRAKGVAIEHRSVVELVRWARDHFDAEELRGVLAATSVCFDLSVFELFVPLASGGRVILAQDALELPLLAAAEEVRLVNTVPSAMAEIVRSGSLPPGVTTVNLAGEALKADLAAAVCRSGGSPRLLNLYGPSEDTTYSTAAVVAPDSEAPTIGRPLIGARVHVLDPDGKPLPVGVPGELHLGGVGLARGYLDRPSLTATSFVPDGQGRVPGQRLYRTGDLARFLPDGELAFLGRLDHQVKVRGFRVETGEVESVLERHPAVADAAVILREDLPAGPGLVAYTVASGPRAPDPQALREHLERFLPAYMTPAFFVALPALPLTLSGKVDRRALPAPARRAVGSSWEGPRTPVEEVLASLWEELLGLGRVGRDDDFFELGGHSLLATRLVSRVRRVFGVELTLRTVFERPSVRRLASAVEEARSPGSSGVSDAGIALDARIPRRGPQPLSPSQERLWFLDRLDSGSPAYNLSGGCVFEGRLSLPRLHRALRGVAARHGALRTRFAEIEGEPVQVVEVGPAVSCPVADLSGLPAERRAREADLLPSRVSRISFDLHRAPLWQVLLVRESPVRHLGLVVMHHVISDGWSVAIFLRDLADHYRGPMSGEELPPPPPVEYVEFSAWQRRRLSEGLAERQLAYWRSRLDGAPSRLNLPLQRPRTSLQSHRGGTLDARLAPALGDDLRALGRSARASLFMVLLAAFKVLLSRWTGQRDLVVGSPVAGRAVSEIEDTIGLFLNTLALRTDLGGDPGFRELLDRERDGALDAFAHQDVPFERVIEELRPQRDLSRTPLVQVLFNMLNLPAFEARLPGLSVAPLEIRGALAKLDLTLYAREVGRGIDLELVYDADLFDQSWMEELLLQYERILRAAVEAPDRPISEISLLTPQARGLLPDPAALLPYGRHEPVHVCFLNVARRAPERTALRGETESWSYGEVSRRAGRVAAELTRSGVDPGSVVAVEARRTPDLAWVLLGVLEAGAAFLLLDPELPPARQAAALRAARPRAYLSLSPGGEGPSGEVSDCLGELGIEPRRSLLGRGRLLRGQAVEPTRPSGEREGRELAYVAFTSGSTGEPLGILGEHGPLAHFVSWYGDEFALGAEDRFAVLSGLAHDPLLRDLFAPLSLGAAVCFPPVFETSGAGSAARPGLRWEPRVLRAWLAREAVTVVHWTPGLARLIAGEDGDEPTRRLPALRRAFFGGEALTGREVRLVRRLAPGADCVNVYGTTETPQVVAWYRATCEEDSEEPIPIGRGASGAQLLVLAGAEGTAGVGELGEIAVRSPYLARGYLGQPELERARFSAAGSLGGEARVYRTGDLGRYRPDGVVEIVGRADDQVAVRGHRVEPGEVERALLRYAAVAEAVVLPGSRIPAAAKMPAAAEVLWAYVVLRGGAKLDGARIREHLRRLLPEYMLPGGYVDLERLPLTVNGKLDRRALPSPRREGAAPEHVPPATPAEGVLAALWQQVLGVERVGARDDFFDLGGHSLSAGRLVSRVRQAFGVELPLRGVFEDPTLAALARRIDGLRRSAVSAPAPALERAVDGGVRPLSFAQERLWFLEQLAPGNSAYNVPAAVLLRGSLDLRTLVRAFDEVVRRHETLRTALEVVEHRPVQAVEPSIPVSLPLIDLWAVPESRRPVAARAVAAELGRHPFALERAPLWRAELVRVSGDEHLLAIAIHHVVSDGWSTEILVRELTEAYDALRRGARPDLPSLPVQYGDYAAWQRRWLTGEVLERHLHHRVESLRGSPGVLEPPADRPRPGARSGRGGSVATHLAPGLRGRVAQVARELQVTPFMVYLGAFEVLLQRLTGQNDLVIGTPVANRTRPEIEDLIGCFANTLVLRTEMEGDEEVAGWLHRLRDATLEAYAHQELPFERLVDELQPERDLSRTPLFQVMFAFQNVPSGRRELSGIVIEPTELERRTARFDWLLTVVEEARSGTGTTIRLEYDRDLFDRTTAVRAISRLETVLSGLVADPRRRVSELPVLGAAERAAVLREWNDTGRSYPFERPLHRLVAAQAERTPEAIALVFGNRHVSYGELRRRVARAADHLAALGVGAEVLVGVAMERSVEMVVALHAVLEVGGAYVPLDPGYPPERLAYMLRDARVPVLLTQDRFRELLPSDGAPDHVLHLGPEAFAADGSPYRGDARRRGASLPQAAAYAIYTSGSTGLPKGTVISHRAIVNRLLWMQDAFPIGPGDRVLQKTPMSFDVSVWEFFWPLIAGAALVVARPEGHKDGAYLSTLIRSERVTVLHFVPSMLRAFLEVRELSGCGGLSHVIASGEALPTDVAADFDRRLGVPLHNLYGPTEAAVDVTRHRFDSGRDLRTVPIGRPVANTSLHLVDRRCRPVPAGAAGELLLGGIQLARGYRGRPGLTAERFMPDPFAAGAGSRLYRTGDLARSLPNGSVEYLGRLDHQVKLRGFRIELGEIESVLARHPGVAAAAAAVVQRGSGAERLIAWVVLRSSDAGLADLDARLRASLPAYMVPSEIIPIEAIPLSPAGKIDRRRLPVPEASPPAPTTGREAGGPVEQALVELCSELLAVPIGPHDDFYAAGGNSLLATQLASRIRRVFDVDLPLRALFESPTPAGLAVRVGGALGNTGAIPPIEVGPRDAPAPLSWAQERLWFLDRLSPGSSQFNIPVLVRLTGDLEPRRLAAGLAEVTRRHEALRVRFEESEDAVVRMVSGPGVRGLPVVDLTALPRAARDGEAARWSAFESGRPFDLERGPLARVVLLRLGFGDHLVLATVHHIVSDAWSMGVLVRELAALYEAGGRREPFPLPEPSVQYRDFARWQRGWLRGDALEGQLEYWRGHLAGAPDELPLRTDRPRSAAPPRGARLSSRLSDDLVRELGTFARGQDATRFMVLLAAFQVLLHHRSGATDLVCGTDLANRTRIELEGLIGFFVNQLPLRMDLSGDPSFRELVARAREVALGAFAHQDVPFHKLVETLRPARAADRAPLVQAKLTLRNIPGRPMELPGLTLALVDPPRTTAQLDLLLTVLESGGRLRSYLEYDAHLFTETTARWVLAGFEETLSAGTRDPEMPLSALSERLAELERVGLAEVQENRQAARGRKLTTIRRAAGGGRKAIRAREPR